MATSTDHELPLLSHRGPSTSPRPSHSTEATLANVDGPGFVSANHRGQAKTNRQQYSSVPTDADDSAPNRGPPENAGRNGKSAKWRPFWLRETVLGIFCLFFLCCTVALPIVLSSSLRHDGLGQVRQHFAKLWRFGPTAVLTLVSVFWSRVELQTLRYMPWTAIQPGQTLDQRRYALDYTAMMPPVVLLQSWRNRHMFVFVVALTSIILKAQVVLAPSLFYLKSFQDSVPAGVQVLDSFSATADVNETLGDATQFAPYYNVKAMYDFGLDFPFGVYKEGAYQTFGPETNSTGRGTTESPLEAIVDGVFMDMKCLPLENYTVIMDDDSERDIYFDLKFEGCNKRVESPLVAPTTWLSFGYYWGVLKPQNDTRPCSSLPQQHDQFMYIGTRWEESKKKNDSQPVVHAFAAVICSPKTWMSKVKVVDDGISPNLTKVSGQEDVPVKTNIWDLLVKSIASEFGSWTKLVYQPRGPIRVIRLFRGETMNGTDESLYHNDVLEKSVLEMTETFGPFVSHYQLRQSSENQITGSNIAESSRLEVNKNACIAMAVLFALCTFIALWAALGSHKTFRAWHRDPATILGSAISLYSNGTSVTGSLSDGGERRKAIWSQSTFAPMALTTWLRTLFVIYSFGLIVGLAVTFGVSRSSHGLVTVNDGTLSIWWTSLPAFCMLLVALYATSSDIAVRGLATLSSLSARACTVREMDISFLDVLGFRALYYSLRLRPLRVTLTQTVAIICAVLPTLSTLLFVSEGVPQLTNTSFEQQSWLGYRNISASDGNDNRLSLRSLLLMYHNSNFTWPQSTHADLFFPTLGIDDAGWTWDADYSLQVNTPAARLVPSCVEIPGTDYKVEPNTTLHMASFTRQLTCPNGTTTPITYSTYSTQTKGVKSEPFAQIAQSLHDPQFIASTCDVDYEGTVNVPPQPHLYQTYLWGRFSTSTMKMEHVGFWQCNYSWYEVPTEVNLVWTNGSFRIDSSNPPVADSSKMRPMDSKLVVPNIYGTSYGPYPNIELRNSTPAFIDYAYRYLMEPFGALKKDNLGDPSQDKLILETLKFSTEIIGAQLANIEMRLGLNESSPMEPTRHGTLPAVSAIVTNKKRHRLVQNSGITIAIIAILCVAFVVNTWALISTCLGRFLGDRRGLLLDMELKGLAPDGFSSIANLDALLRGSNFLDNIPKNAEQIPTNDLYNRMAGLRFRLGWFFRRGAQDREYTIGVLGDENFQFLGGK